MSNVSSTGRLYYPFVRLLFLLLLSLPEGPYLRWIDVKGDVQVLELSSVLEETTSEVRVRLTDGSERTVPVARVLDLVRESRERPDERDLLEARRDVAAGIRPDAARKALDRLARDGAEPWIREYAAAARALLAEQAREEDAVGRLKTFLEENPRSRFVSDCILAEARLRASAAPLPKGLDLMAASYQRIREIDGPIALRARVLSDTMAVVAAAGTEEGQFFDTVRARIESELPENDYGAVVLVEAEAKRAQLLTQRRAADADLAKGREPRAALHEVRKLLGAANLDLPEVRSDIERELGRLLLACGDKEGARGAWERARDLAPDPRRREAAEDALKRLAP